MLDVLRLRPTRAMKPERFKELSLGVVIAVTIVIFSFLADGYLTGRFFNRVTTGFVIVAVLAMAQTMVIVTRNIDLSVGSIVGISAYVTGEFLADHTNTAPVLAVVLAMAIGCGLGLVNGVIVAYAKVPAIVVTLGTMAIYRSWLTEHGQGRSITVSSLPDWVVELPQRTPFALGDLQVRGVLVTVIVLVAIGQILMSRLRWGRRLYAIGSNPEAANQAGLAQKRLVLSAYAACGALSGLAGFLFLARFGTITVVAGEGLELEAVGAAVVGGVSILGGAGTLGGAFLGAFLVTLLDESLKRVDQISEFWRDAILGGLILLAVMSDVILGGRYQRRLSEQVRQERAAAEGVLATTGEANDG